MTASFVTRRPGERLPALVHDPATLGQMHGAFNMLGGLWPLLHLRSFEAVFGPKTDRWLEYTVAGLLTGLGWAQWKAGTPEGWPHARRIGVATAGTLLAIDLVYVPRGRIRWTYLLDAAEEVALLAAWAAASRRTRDQGRAAPTRWVGRVGLEPTTQGL